MTAVTVLTAATINQRRVVRRLTKVGYATPAEGGQVQVSPAGGGATVTMTASRLTELPKESLDAARRVLGLQPWNGVICRFEGPLETSDAWPTVVDIARAVAAEVPLAVLDDHAGTTYLIHVKQGLIPPDDYNQVIGNAKPNDFLRRLLGNN